MLPMALLALSLLGSTVANTLNTVRIPAYRKTLSLNTSAALLHPINYDDRWTTLGFYFIEMGIGTPPQPVQLALDTGSSDMWVPYTNAPACRNASDCPAGTFDPAQSSTYQFDPRPRFDIGYVDGSKTDGNYSLDTVTIKGASLSNFSFAVADIMESSSEAGDTYGLLGLSTQELVDDYRDACERGNCSEGVRTPTFTDALVSAGLIEAPCYSLFLDDRGSQEGSILFGGVDTAKFTGPLVTLHTTPEDNAANATRYAHQQLHLANFTLLINGAARRDYGSAWSTDSVSINQTIPPHVTVAIDSGANGIYLPEKWVYSALQDMPIVSRNNITGRMFVFCEAASANITLAFTLKDEYGNHTDIDVPFHELVVPMRNRSSSNLEPVLQDGKPLCHVALSSHQNVDAILGDPFLRAAYTFYNLEQHTISIAQAANNSTGENVVAVGKGPVPKLFGTG